MTANQSAYVFVSPDNKQIAISTLHDGANLPSLDDSGRWFELALVSLTAESLGKYVVDADAAIANLTATGFYVMQIGAKVIPFPRPHRRTA